jgi:hypothetical protein
MKQVSLPAALAGAVSGLVALVCGAMPAYGQSNGAGAAGSAVFIVFGCFMVLLVLALLGFQIWMIVDVVTKCPDRDNTKLIWLLIVILAGWIGGLIYYFVQRPKNAMQSRPPSPPPPRV